MQRQGLESGSKGNKGSVSYGEEVEIQEENKVALSQTGEVRIVDGVEDPCLTSFTISVCGISPVSWREQEYERIFVRKLFPFRIAFLYSE